MKVVQDAVLADEVFTSGRPGSPAAVVHARIELGGSAGGFDSHRVNLIRHNLHQHPLLQLPRIAQLAHELMPTKQCRFVRPGVTQTSEFFHTPKVPDGRSIDEVFERIEQPGAWVALYNIQTEPEYRRLIDELIDSVRPVVEREQPGIFNPAGYFFISAPPSVTPFHLDSENNFWLQVRGRKRMTVFDRCDRELVPVSAVEEFIIHRSLDGVRLDPALRHHGRDFDVGPGDGVYFPSTSPHMTSTTAEWARPGDGVSVSLAITFYTAVTRQHARVHQCNRVLRRLGVEPRFPGQSRWRDAVKAPLGRLITAALVKFRNYVVPPGGA